MTDSMTVMTNVMLRIDPQACDGIGMCAHLVPDLITLDRWGYPIIPTRVLDVEEVAQATKAVKGCPKKALHLIANK
ncbi:MAG: ferredoxin [Actinobacteria bacterium]|nr:ferredoxin [Actinomycetota bacterium]